MTQGASTLQDFPLQSSIEAVKASLDFASYDDFRRYLIEHLPYNSPQTRRRYADLIGHRYFPGQSLSNLLTDIWRPTRTTQSWQTSCASMRSRPSQ